MHTVQGACTETVRGQTMSDLQTNDLVEEALHTLATTGDPGKTWLLLRGKHGNDAPAPALIEQWRDAHPEQYRAHQTAVAGQVEQDILHSTREVILQATQAEQEALRQAQTLL